jgi:predicted nucleic acid-binding Zn ribbon protein
MTADLCPVCSSPIEVKPRGRPRSFCSGVCTERARLRRRRAARLLEYAVAVEAGVGRPGFGSAAYVQARANGIRADAFELLASIGELEERGS